MNGNKDLPTEIDDVKRSLSLKKKEKLDEIIKHAKLLYEDLFESEGMRHVDQMPFVGRFAVMIERLEKFKEKEL
ncbi:MAG: hypothetical protein ACRD8W_31285 [Nitrososphaeraceae archaeon]